MRTKTLFAAALVGLGSMANAQTTQVTNNDGIVVTPEAGDWAIGFNAAPLLNYAGNMFNGTTGNSMSSAFVTSNQAIYGKYFVDENTAYRASLRIMYGSGSSEMLTDTNTAGGAPEYITDKVTQSGAGIVLGGGIEKRRGNNRLQGYYGGEAMLTFGGVTPNVKYDYELEYNAVNNGTVATSRLLSSKAGSTFGFGVRGFIGAEYFFAPKISIAAEYGWGLNLSSTKGSETVVENWGLADANATVESSYEITTMGGKTSSFGIDTDNLGGAIRLMFHF